MHGCWSVSMHKLLALPMYIDRPKIGFFAVAIAYIFKLLNVPRSIGNDPPTRDRVCKYAK
jgi:hypothetical protein